MKKYFLVLIATVLIFSSAFFVNGVINNKKLEYIRSEQETLALDILNMETKFSLVKNALTCENLLKEDFFSEDIRKIGTRLSYLEGIMGNDNQDVIKLKKYYSLIQSKEYVLVNDLFSKCENSPNVILFFYSSNAKDECSDCAKQGYVLEALAENYPGKFRIYSFDFNLDDSVVGTLKNLYNVKKVPSVVIDQKTYDGYMTYTEMEKLLGLSK